MSDDPEPTTEEQGPQITQTGLVVTIFRVNILASSAGLAPLFHQALGLLKEHRVVHPIYQAVQQNRVNEAQGVPSVIDVSNMMTNGMLTTHMHMLRLQSTNAATSLLLFVDNGTRVCAANGGRKVTDIKGGPAINAVTLLEAIRATCDWARHHYEWANNSSHWPVKTLAALGLSVDDPVLPAKVLELYDFGTYEMFSRACVDAVREMVHSWHLPNDWTDEFKARLNLRSFS